MIALLIALVSLVAAQTPADDAPEPIPVVDGVPSEAEILAKLRPSPKHPRSFRATWEERASLRRPARIAWRVTVKAGERISVERFDMSAAERVTERYDRAPTGTMRPLSEAPAWVRWLGGSERTSVLRALKLDGERRALDVVERRVLWVLGAHANQNDRAQLRVDRETGLLQRIVERRAVNDAKQLLDVALFDRSEDGPAPWLPRRLRVREGDSYAVLHLVSSSVADGPLPGAAQGAEP